MLVQIGIDALRGLCRGSLNRCAMSHFQLFPYSLFDGCSHPKSCRIAHRNGGEERSHRGVCHGKATSH
jgi:hypothetical protein